MSNINTTLKWEFGSNVTERKVRYDQSIVDYDCQLIGREKGKAVLFHQIEFAFEIVLDAEAKVLHIPEGTYTLGFYWEDRPYNIYYWRNQAGQYIGAYLNIVKNTIVDSDMIIFEDLIIDVVILPDGTCYVLDEDELPEKLSEFENGAVAATLEQLLEILPNMIMQIHKEAALTYPHNRVARLLK